MLEAIGLNSLEDLYAHIPPEVRLDRTLHLPKGLSEPELVGELQRLAARNRHNDELVCFAGAGAYDHYVPSVVWAMAGQSELYTSYTPYQPELSQGILQALFEYQSMICDLTGLEVSNASLYDGATAIVEAVNLSRAATGRDRVLVADTVDPRYVRGPHHLRQGSGVRAGDVRLHRRAGERARRRRRRGVRDRAAPEPAGDPGARAGAVRRGEGRGSAGRPGVRPAVARRARPARGARGRRGRGRGTGPGQPPQLRRPVPGDHRRADAGRPADAGTHRGGDPRRRRQRRLRPDPAGPRAAHPPRQGDLEHLHQPDADGHRGDRVPGVAGTAGPP